MTDILVGCGCCVIFNSLDVLFKFVRQKSPNWIWNCSLAGSIINQVVLNTAGIANALVDLRWIGSAILVWLSVVFFLLIVLGISGMFAVRRVVEK